MSDVGTAPAGDGVRRITINGRSVGCVLPANAAVKWAAWLTEALPSIREALAAAAGAPPAAPIRVAPYTAPSASPDAYGAAEALRIKNALAKGESP